MKNYNIIFTIICLIILSYSTKPQKENQLSENEQNSIEFNNLRNLEEEEGINPTSYHKSSGGLSTGGSVGIAVAGVVVAVAALGIAIALKGAAIGAVGVGAAGAMGGAGAAGGAAGAPVFSDAAQIASVTPHFNVDHSGATIVSRVV